MQRSPREDLHRAAGARFAAGGASAVPLTFGDVPAEYKAGATGAALLDETERGALRVRGADAGDFLHRVLANRVKGLGVGAGARNMLLSAKGKVEHLFDLAVDADGFLLSTPLGGAAALAAGLDRYLFGEKVTLADTTAMHAPIAIAGPRGTDILTAVLGPVPDLARGNFAHIAFGATPVVLYRVAVAGSLSWRLDAGPDGVRELWSALERAGARPIGRVATDSLRIEAGWGEAGLDVDANVYPQEARLEDGFSLEKGCYIGQEVVAKIDTYGGINKRLVLVAISHDDPLARGTRLMGRDDTTGEPRELGLITSWAYSFVRDGGLAIAYVKRRHQKEGTRFELLGPEGTALAGTAQIVPMPQREGALTPTGEFE